MATQESEATKATVSNGEVKMNDISVYISRPGEWVLLICLRAVCVTANV